MQNITKKSLIKYFLIFFLFIIFANAGIYEVIYPFAIGFCLALIWHKQKIFVVLLAFAIASFLQNFCVAQIIQTLWLCFFVCLFVGVHSKFKKPISFPLYVFYSFVSSLGVLANFFLGGNLLFVILTIVLAVMFMCVCKEVLGSMSFGFKQFGTNQIVCLMLAVCGLGVGLYELSIFGVSILKFVGVILILGASYVFKFSHSVMFAGILGLAPLIASGSSVFLAPFLIFALVAGALKSINKFLPAVAVVLCEIALGFGLGIYPAERWVDVVFVLLGATIFVLIPQNVFSSLSEFVFGSNSAMKNIVQRSSETLCKRLYALGDVFGEMDFVFRSMVKGGMDKDELRELLVKEVKEKICENCPEKNLCHRKCYQETNRVLETLVQSAMERGRTTLLDVPVHLTTRCKKVASLVGQVNGICADYRQYAGVMNNLDTTRVLIADELKGVSEIMKNLAGEVNKNISFDSVEENKIVSELAFFGVVCSECVIYQENVNVVSVTLVVRNQDCNNSKICEVVGKICKSKMMIADCQFTQNAGWSVLTLKTESRFGVAFGTASQKKDGSKVSGDAFSVIKLSESKFLLALCDGMGSGQEAERTSALAIGLVENFYKAGFNNEIILSSINRLLVLNKDDIFNALDICVLDTFDGVVDFIKMGAPPSFLKSLGQTEQIDGGALPLGIVQDAPPAIVKKVVRGGDYVFLCTDGILDSFASDEIFLNYINNIPNGNPQQIAEQILEKASENGVRDDMTIIIAKIYEN